jgi:hypothetical protein
MLRATEAGKHYGPVHFKDLAVLEALLFGFHNAHTGLCFPSYETIAKAAGCARSTVYVAIKRLEDAKLLTWVNRIKRIYEPAISLWGEVVRGGRSRVVRTSNGYRFTIIDVENSSKSERRSGTPVQDSFLLTVAAAPAPKIMNPDLEAALDRLKSAMTGTGRTPKPAMISGRWCGRSRSDEADYV